MEGRDTEGGKEGGREGGYEYTCLPKINLAPHQQKNV